MAYEDALRVMRERGMDDARGFALTYPRDVFKYVCALGYDQVEASGSTVRGYTKNWKLFVEYCDASGECPLPAAVDTVVQFIKHGLSHDAGWKHRVNLKPLLAASIPRSSMLIAVTAISGMHRFCGHENPTNSSKVRGLLDLSSWTTPPQQLALSSLTKAQLDELLNELEGPSLSNLRARAIISCAYYLFMQAEELAALTCDDLSLPLCQCTISMSPYEGRIGQRLSLTQETTLHLKAWLCAATIQTGSVFVSLRRASTVVGTTLTGDCIRKIIERTAARSRIPGLPQPLGLRALHHCRIREASMGHLPITQQFHEIGTRGFMAVGRRGMEIADDSPIWMHTLRRY